MDLIRSILIQVEAADDSRECGQLDFCGHSQSEVYYHIELMQQRGLIDATIHKDWAGEIISASISGLTWDGLDYLDAMRDDRVWSRAKKAIASTVGSTTFDVIKQACTMVATEMIKSGLGL